MVMTSKISFCKIALEDLRRKNWMLALSALGSFLALPVAFLLFNRDYMRRSMSYSDVHTEQISRLAGAYREFFTEEAMVIQGVVLFAMAFIAGICGFGYLYSRKKSDLYHALPIKRGQLFLIQWLNGLLVWLIPMVSFTLVTLVMMFFNLLGTGGAYAFGSLFLTALKAMGCLLTAYLVLYHFCLICVGFSGNAVGAICSTLLLGCAAIAVYGLTEVLCSGFFDTFVTLDLNILQIVWASPVISAGFVLALADTAENLSDQAELYATFFLIMNLAVLVFNWCAACQLFQNRPSELAERGINRHSAQHLLRILAALLGGTCGALFFYYLTDDSRTLGWILFGEILGGGFCFGVMNTILHMNFRTFFHCKKELVFCIAAGSLFFLSFVYDWTGYDARIPRESQIVSMAAQCYRMNDESPNYTLDEAGNLIRVRHAHYLRDLDYTETENIYQILSTLSNQEHLSDENGGVYALDIQVRLKSGGTFLRRYRFSKQDAEVLRPLFESDVYRDQNFGFSLGKLGMPDEIRLDSRLTNLNEFTLTDETQIRALMEAYRQDFLNRYQLENLNNGCEVMRLMEYYQGSNLSLRMSVLETDVNTIALLSELYPLIPFSPEQMELESITLHPQPTTTFAGSGPAYSRELLGSYFGLDGYPDYEEYLKTFEDQEEYPEDAEVLEQTITRETPSEIKPVYDSERGYYQYKSLTLETEEDMRALLPYLHIGRLSTGIFQDPEEQLIYLGHCNTIYGMEYDCYVKTGELPEEWIDRLLAEGEWDVYY